MSKQSNLLWEQNDKNNKNNTSYYERISNAYHNNSNNSSNSDNSSVSNKTFKSRRGSQVANGRTWENVLENGLQLPGKNVYSNRSPNNFLTSRSSPPARTRKYNSSNIKINTPYDHTKKHSPTRNNKNSYGFSSSGSDYKYNNYIQNLQRRSEKNESKLIVPKAKTVNSPPSRQLVASYMLKQKKYMQGRRKSKSTKYKNSPPLSTQQRFKQNNKQRNIRNRSTSPQQNTPEYSERKLLREIKELAAGVKFTPSRAVGLGDMVIELSSRWRSSTTLALKTIAQLEEDLTKKFEEHQRLSKQLRNTDLEYSKLKDKQELAYNFLKDKKLMDEFQTFLKVYSPSNSNGKTSSNSAKSKGNGKSGNNADKSQAKTDLQVKVEALSAAVRDGDSKLVSKFFDHLETENGDKKLNLNDNSGYNNGKKTVAAKQGREKEIKNANEGEDEKVREEKGGKELEKDESVNSKDELLNKYLEMEFLTMEYIPKSIKDDRRAIVDLALKHGRVDEQLGNKIRSMPFNSSEQIPESVLKDRENGLKLLNKCGTALEQMAKEASAGGMPILSAPPIKILVKVQSRKYASEKFIPIAVQQDRRSFLSFLFEDGDTTFNHAREALRLPYGTFDDIPAEIHNDRIETIELMFGKIDFKNCKIIGPPTELSDNDDISKTTAEEKQSEKQPEKDEEIKQEDYANKTDELILDQPSIEMTSTVNKHPFNGGNNIPPEIKQDRQSLLSKIYDTEKHTIKSLVSIVTDRFDGEVDVPEFVNEDRVECLNILYGQDIAHLIQVQSQPFGGMAKAPAVVLRDRQQTMHKLLEDEDFDDDDYNRILAMSFDGKKEIPDSIIQDRMKTIHILMKRYDLTPEELREEELEHARKVAQQKLKELPFSGLVDNVPASVSKDREESLNIIYSPEGYTEQQARQLVLASPYAGSTFIPEAILTDRHARLAMLLSPDLVEHHQPDHPTPQLHQHIEQQVSQLDQHPNHQGPQLSSPPQTHQQPKHLSPSAHPDQQVSPQQQQIHHPNHQALQSEESVGQQPPTQEELQKINKLLQAPYAGSPIVPDAVAQDRQESLQILMGDSGLEVEALIEIILKKPYNGSERIPKSILEDRNAQLEIILNGENVEEEDNFPDPVEPKSAIVAPPPPPPPANVHTVIQQQNQERNQEQEKSKESDIKEEEKTNKSKQKDVFASDRISSMKKVQYENKPLHMTPASISEDRKAVISIVMNHKGDNMVEIASLVKKIKYANSPYIPKGILKFRKDLLEAFHGDKLDDINFEAETIASSSTTTTPIKVSETVSAAAKTEPGTANTDEPTTKISTPKDEKTNMLAELETKIMRLKYADDSTVPETVLADRTVVFEKVKSMVDLDKFINGTIDDEKVNTIAEVILNKLAFQQIPALDAPDEVRDDRMGILKILFPHVPIDVETGNNDNNGDTAAADNAFEDRVAKAERLVAMKEQALKDLERSTLEGLL